MHQISALGQRRQMAIINYSGSLLWYNGTIVQHFLHTPLL